MSNTIKLEIPFNSTNVELVKDLLVKAAALAEVKDLPVVDAEEVKAPAKKAPAKKAPASKPEPEEIEEDFELEDADDEEGVTLDDIKLRQAEVVNGAGNRDMIISKLKSFGPDVKGPATIPAEKYQEFYDFLSKLKK